MVCARTANACPTSMDDVELPSNEWAAGFKCLSLPCRPFHFSPIDVRSSEMTRTERLPYSPGEAPPPLAARHGPCSPRVPIEKKLLVMWVAPAWDVGVSHVQRARMRVWGSACLGTLSHCLTGWAELQLNPQKCGVSLKVPLSESINQSAIA